MSRVYTLASRVIPDKPNAFTPWHTRANLNKIRCFHRNPRHWLDLISLCTSDLPELQLEMIFETLNFLRNRIESYLGNTGGEPVTILAHPWSNSDDTKNSPFLNTISLINIEEEKVFKTPGKQFTVTQNGSFYAEPDIKLNLFLLFSSYNKSYDESLKYISKIISFFQVQTVYDHTVDVTVTDQKLLLDPSIEQLIIELYSPSFDQLNQIWAALSIGYLPSVIYKVRMLVVDANQQQPAPIITKLDTKIQNYG